MRTLDKTAVALLLGGLYSGALWAQPHAEHGALHQLPIDHSAMGHKHIGHDVKTSAPQAMPMDHSQMDHSAIQHGALEHGAARQAHTPQPTAHPHSAPNGVSRTPIPVLTDADRAAAFPDVQGHKVHDTAINHFLLIDQLEYQNADAGSALAWDVSGWVGGDINRLWLRSEGQRTQGVTEEAELQLLYGRALGPWWDWVAGMRQDFKPASSQTWAALGVQGMALYGFEAEATAFLGEDQQSALRLAGEYDMLLSNKWILQPTAELNFYSKNDAARAVGAGLANAEFGLRLRYEIVRQFAPYIGLTWQRAYGNSADYARAKGDKVEQARFVAGVRLWF